MSPFCPACGNNMNVEDKFCRVCGGQASTGPGSATPLPSAPVGPKQTSSKAIISLVCGLLFFIPLAFVAAIVFGHLSLSEIRKSAGRLQGEGMAISGLVLGYLWLAGIPIFLIIAAIAIPNLLRARMAANESSAVASIRTINAAELTYQQSHLDTGYTCSLPDLADQINTELASGRKTGYTFELTGCAGLPAGGANTKYQLVASPLTPNQTGVRAFCSDESAVVRMDAGGSSQRCLESGIPLQ